MDFVFVMEDDEDELDGVEEVKYEDFFGGCKRVFVLEGGEGDDGEEEEEVEEDEEDMDVFGDDFGEDVEDDKFFVKENGVYELIIVYEKWFVKLCCCMDVFE